VQAAGGQQLGVGLGGRVAPHRLIHRGCQGDRRIGGQYQSGQQVIGHTLGQARHQVGSGWRDQDQISPACQFDMAHGGFGGGVEQVEVYRMSGERLQGERGDEFTTALGHDHPHIGVLIFESANQLCTFIRSNTTADANNDAFPIQPLHRPAFSENGYTAAPIPPQARRSAKVGLR
jgi:hypothetical protein